MKFTVLQKVNILHFPNGVDFATIPFSESIGFIAKVNSALDADPVSPNVSGSFVHCTSTKLQAIKKRCKRFIYFFISNFIYNN